MVTRRGSRRSISESVNDNSEWVAEEQVNGQEYNLVKTQDGYLDENAYTEPYRNITNWFLTTKSGKIGSNRVALPEDMNKNLNYLCLYGNLESNNNSEKLVCAVKIDALKAWCFDRHYQDRGIWVLTKFAWYKLKKPCDKLITQSDGEQISQEILHLPLRAKCGLLSNILDLMSNSYGILNAENVTYHANRTLEMSYKMFLLDEEEQKQDPTLCKDSFDIFLLQRHPKFVKTQFKGVDTKFSNNSSVMKGLTALSKELSDAIKKKEHWATDEIDYRKSAEMAEERSSRYPWGCQKLSEDGKWRCKLIKLRLFKLPQTASKSNPTNPNLPHIETIFDNQEDLDAVQKKQPSHSKSPGKRTSIVKKVERKSGVERKTPTNIKNSLPLRRSSNDHLVGSPVELTYEVVKDTKIPSSGQKISGKKRSRTLSNEIEGAIGPSSTTSVQSGETELKIIFATESYYSTDRDAKLNSIVDGNYLDAAFGIADNMFDAFAKQFINVDQIYCYEYICVYLECLMKSTDAVKMRLFKESGHGRSIFVRWRKKTMQQVNEYLRKNLDLTTKRAEDLALRNIVKLLLSCGFLLQHPNILQKFEKETDLDFLVIIMEVKKLAKRAQKERLIKSCQKAEYFLEQIKTNPNQKKPLAEKSPKTKKLQKVNKKRIKRSSYESVGEQNYDLLGEMLQEKCKPHDRKLMVDYNYKRLQRQKLRQQKTERLDKDDRIKDLEQKTEELRKQIHEMNKNKDKEKTSAEKVSKQVQNEIMGTRIKKRKIVRKSVSFDSNFKRSCLKTLNPKTKRSISASTGIASSESKYKSSGWNNSNSAKSSSIGWGDTKSKSHHNGWGNSDTTTNNDFNNDFTPIWDDSIVPSSHGSDPSKGHNNLSHDKSSSKYEEKKVDSSSVKNQWNKMPEKKSNENGSWNFSNSKSNVGKRGWGNNNKPNENHNSWNNSKVSSNSSNQTAEKAGWGAWKSGSERQCYNSHEPSSIGAIRSPKSSTSGGWSNAGSSNEIKRKGGWGENNNDNKVCWNSQRPGINSSGGKVNRTTTSGWKNSNNNGSERGAGGHDAKEDVMIGTGGWNSHQPSTNGTRHNNGWGDNAQSTNKDKSTESTNEKSVTEKQAWNSKNATAGWSNSANNNPVPRKGGWGNSKNESNRNDNRGWGNGSNDSNSKDNRGWNMPQSKVESNGPNTATNFKTGAKCNEIETLQKGGLGNDKESTKSNGIGESKIERAEKSDKLSADIGGWGESSENTARKHTDTSPGTREQDDSENSKQDNQNSSQSQICDDLNSKTKETSTGEGKVNDQKEEPQIEYKEGKQNQTKWDTSRSEKEFSQNVDKSVLKDASKSKEDQRNTSDLAEPFLKNETDQHEDVNQLRVMINQISSRMKLNIESLPKFDPEEDKLFSSDSESSEVASICPSPEKLA